jgi:hypothetical protein
MSRRAAQEPPQDEVPHTRIYRRLAHRFNDELEQERAVPPKAMRDHRQENHGLRLRVTAVPFPQPPCLLTLHPSTQPQTLDPSLAIDSSFASANTLVPRLL